MGKTQDSRASSGDGAYYFDADEARRALAFAGQMRLRTGEHAGQPIGLLEYQREAIEQIFGWRQVGTGKLRYRRVSMWIPRGNGKTPFAAVLALCFLFLLGEEGAEIYSVAADREQAQISFDDAAYMVAQEAELFALTRTYRRSLFYPRRSSVWKVVSSDARGKHGARPFVVIFDELHTQKSRDLWTAMETGLGKRRDSIMVTISTAGVYDPESLAWQEYTYARKVADGVLAAPHFLPVIFEAAADCDPFDESAWAVANPGLGRTVHLEALRQEASKAREDAGALVAFRQFRLNHWVSSLQAAISPEVWGRNDALPEISGRPRCFIGLDVSQRDDLSSLAIWVPHDDGTYSLVCEHFIPGDKVMQLERAHGVPYSQWVAAGHVRLSGENSVDTRDIRDRIAKLRTEFDVIEVGFDPWNAAHLAQELGEQDGLRVVEIPQQVRHLSEPTKGFLGLLADGKVRHGANPVLRWMASNLVLYVDGNGNVKPKKGAKNLKIDGIVAAIMAHSRCSLSTNKQSVYQARGLRVL